MNPRKRNRAGKKGMRRTRSYQDRELKLLWGMAAARCAFPDCQIVLVAPPTKSDPSVVLGQVSHIVGLEDDGPRGDPAYPDSLRNKYENLILLCPGHHSLVDGQDSSYSTDTLKNWKVAHERWVLMTLAAQMPRVSFAELEFVTNAMTSNPCPPTESFVLVPPKEKMERNGLTAHVGSLLTMGLAKSQEVAAFIERAADIDPEFPERLKGRFVAEYIKHRNSGLSGDALFQELRVLASRGSQAFEKQAAGIAVLSYLFEKCEVFES